MTKIPDRQIEEKDINLTNSGSGPVIDDGITISSCSGSIADNGFKISAGSGPIVDNGFKTSDSYDPDDDSFSPMKLCRGVVYAPYIPMECQPYDNSSINKDYYSTLDLSKVSITPTVPFTSIPDIDQLELKIQDQESLIANLAVTVGKLMMRVDKLECELAEKDLGLQALGSKVAFLVEEKMDQKSVSTDTFPMTLGERLREAYAAENRPDVVTRLLKELDALLWPIFDADKGLSRVGGHYVLQNVVDDLIKSNAELKRADLDIDFEDIVDCAIRWSKSRTRWYFNVKYWVKQVGPFVILKRNRFAFQAEDGVVDTSKALL